MIAEITNIDYYEGDALLRYEGDFFCFAIPNSNQTPTLEDALKYFHKEGDLYCEYTPNSVVIVITPVNKMYW